MHNCTIWRSIAGRTINKANFCCDLGLIIMLKMAWALPGSEAWQSKKRRTTVEQPAFPRLDKNSSNSMVSPWHWGPYHSRRNLSNESSDMFTPDGDGFTVTASPRRWPSRQSTTDLHHTALSTTACLSFCHLPMTRDSRRKVSPSNSSTQRQMKLRQHGMETRASPHSSL